MNLLPMKKIRNKKRERTQIFFSFTALPLITTLETEKKVASSSLQVQMSH